MAKLGEDVKERLRTATVEVLLDVRAACLAAGANPLEHWNQLQNRMLAAAAQSTILTFAVPSGFWFFMTQLGLFFSSSVFNPGDFLFAVDKNTPLGGGTFQGVPLTDLQNVGDPFGGFVNGPWDLTRAEVFAPEDVIRAKVTHVNLAGGAPNVFGAMFGGWLVPTIEVPHAE